MTVKGQGVLRPTLGGKNPAQCPCPLILPLLISWPGGGSWGDSARPHVGAPACMASERSPGKPLRCPPPPSSMHQEQKWPGDGRGGVSPSRQLGPLAEPCLRACSLSPAWHPDSLMMDFSKEKINSQDDRSSTITETIKPFCPGDVKDVLSDSPSPA